MRYVEARYNEHIREQTYRIYVTDSLYYHAQNKALSIRYSELIDNKPVDNRTGDEVAADVIERIGLRFNE